MNKSMKSVADQVTGKVKKAIGTATSNEALEARGERQIQQGKGNRQAAPSEQVDASAITPGLPVVCSEGGKFAVVDHMEGSDTIKLKRDESGQHHYIPLSWVTRVDSEVHVDRPGDEAMQQWSTEA